MAPHLQHLFITFLLTMHHLIIPSQTTQFNQGYLLKLTKDLQTHQYTTQLLIGTPQLPTKLVLHLSGPSLWLNCPPSSPSLNFITHPSLQCSMTRHQQTSSNFCHVPQQNPFTGESSFGDLAEDLVSLDGISTVHSFLFSCSPEYLVNGAKGVLGFGRSKIAFHSQMVNKFAYKRRFSVCLSSSDGFIVSEGRFSKHLSYTPLVSMSSSRGGVDHGYYVNVNGIKINGWRLAIGRPIGAVEISSTVPYSVMESSLYAEFAKAFVRAGRGMNMTVVESPVAQFGVCFSSRVGTVPEIELVLQSELVKWRIRGMVEVSDSVMCLGVVDGGLGMTGSVILGGYQLEEHLLEFDLGTGMMGFGSALLMEGGSCSNMGASLSTLKGSL